MFKILLSLMHLVLLYPLQKSQFDFQKCISSNFTKEILSTLGTGHRLQQTLFLKVCNSINSSAHLCEDVIVARIRKRQKLPNRVCHCSKAYLAVECSKDFNFFQMYSGILQNIHFEFRLDHRNQR